MGFVMSTMSSNKRLCSEVTVKASSVAEGVVYYSPIFTRVVLYRAVQHSVLKFLQLKEIAQSSLKKTLCLSHFNHGTTLLKMPQSPLRHHHYKVDIMGLPSEASPDMLLAPRQAPNLRELKLLVQTSDYILTFNVLSSPHSSHILM